MQAAKEWQRQLRLPTTPSGGTYMTACMLHKSQKVSSSLSRLTKKVPCAVRDKVFLEVKEAETNAREFQTQLLHDFSMSDNKSNHHQQHESIIGALRAAAPKWEFQQINFVMGNRGSVVESDFYTKLKKLDVHERKKNKLFADAEHVT
jgi:hypothetical protein